MLVTSVEKFTSSCKILESGSVITFSNDDPVKFVIHLEKPEDTSTNITVEILFKQDETKNRDLSRAYNAEEATVQLICMNFDNPFGTGTTQAVKILTYQGKAVYINFWVFRLGNTKLKRIDYTFYQEA